MPNTHHLSKFFEYKKEKFFLQIKLKAGYIASYAIVLTIALPNQGNVQVRTSLLSVVSFYLWSYNACYHVLVYADDVNLIGDGIRTIQKMHMCY